MEFPIKQKSSAKEALTNAKEDVADATNCGAEFRKAKFLLTILAYIQ